MQALDLYAKIEPLIGFYDEYDELYESYIEILKPLHVEHVLDIGCGNGKFLLRLKESGFKAIGIDRSKEMVSIATSLGVDAKEIELEDLQDSFDCATAIGDVLNYMKRDELIDFFLNLKKSLKKESYFVADINTLSGFEEVAEGLLLKETKDKFLAIEADFENFVLNTKITLFEKHKNSYLKYSDKISQYYHPIEFFKNIDGFKLLETIDISMFGHSDKTILIFKA